MRTISIVVVAFLAVALIATSAAAQTTKTAIGWSGTQIVSATADTEWTNVLTSYIKTSTNQDAALTFSAESILGTYVFVKSSAGAVVTDTSSAGVQIRILVDGVTAFPGAITFDSRLMKLSAKLGEAIVTDPATGLLVSAGDQWISIYENTKQAHSFTWFAQNLGTGEHTVQVQAKINIKSGTNEVAPEVTEAYLGSRTLLIDQVNLKQSVFPAAN